MKPKKCKSPSPDPQKDTSSDEQSSPDVKNKSKMIGKQKGGKAGKPGKPSVPDFDAIPTIAERVLLHAQKHSGQCSWNMFSK